MSTAAFENSAKMEFQFNIILFAFFAKRVGFLFDGPR